MNTHLNTSTEVHRSKCIEHMHANGIVFEGCLDADGNLHRFSMDSKKNQPDEWYRCYEGVSSNGHPYLVCSYGTWSGGQDNFIYKSYENSRSISHAERIEIKSREEQRRKELEKELLNEKMQRIEYAKEVWRESVCNPTLKGHVTYLERKHVDAYGIKCRVDRGTVPLIVIPICDLDGQLQAIQCIQEDGTKRIYGAKKGNFHVIGEVEVSSRIYIVEGYATGASVHKATGSPVVVAFDCGNLKPVVHNIREKYPKARLIIAADDDCGTNGNPGKTKAMEVAKVYGCEVVLPAFPEGYKLDNGNLPTDFNDLHVHSGLDEVRSQLQDLTKIVQKNCFQFRSAHSLIQGKPKVNWLIKSYLDTGSLCVLFGEPGCMKSFLAIDMGCCVATGREWHGFPVRKSGPVFYIAGEGFNGLSKRIRAWSLSNKVDLQDVPFFISDRPAQLLDPSNVDEVIHAVEELKRQCGQPVLIIIDTLNRNFGPGDENSTADMTSFVNAVDSAIRIPYDCTVLIVHHSPLNDAKRARGASALRGALDFECCLSKQGSDVRKLSVTKVKDHEPACDIFFRPKSVSLDDWIDEEGGETMTSCVLEKVEGNAVGSKSSGTSLKGPQQVAFDCLTKLYDISDDRSKGVHIDAWRDAAYKAGISLAGTPDANRQAFIRAIKYLKTNGCVEVSNKYWKPCVTLNTDRTFMENVTDKDGGQT